MTFKKKKSETETYKDKKEKAGYGYLDCLCENVKKYSTLRDLIWAYINFDYSLSTRFRVKLQLSSFYRQGGWIIDRLLFFSFLGSGWIGIQIM